MTRRVVIVAAVLFLASLQLVAQTTGPAAFGQWGPVFRWPVVAIHLHVLPDGHVLSWERKDTVLTTETWLWDPKAPEDFKKVMNPFASVFCSGHTFLPDGKLLVAGGHHFKDGFGERTATIFNGPTDTWTKGPNMNDGRWYPTATALANGDVLVVGGSAQFGEEARPNPLPQVWQTATSTWRDLTGAIRAVPLYPLILLAPDGRAIMVGPNPESMFLDTAGTGDWTEGPQANGPYRDYGSAVEYRPGKILLVGGGPPTDSAETLDLNVSPLKWRTAAHMAFKRRQLNATLLPDGTVLVTGGSSSPGFNNADGKVLASEIWDPDTDRWTTVARQDVRRLYHSTAALLPDGRVLSAGGGMPPSPEGGDTDHRNAQIYSPAYLYRGPRPQLTSAPYSVGFYQPFTVSTPYSADIARVTWIRLSSVTHAFNQSQRFNELAFTRSGAAELTVTSPRREECPPGPYLLFLLNGKGVPSEGKVVFIR
jgi:galactose oxidase